MNHEMPRWEPGNPAKSFTALVSAINEKARFTFLQDGSHVQLAFLVRDSGEMGMLPVMKAGDPAAFHSLIRASVKKLRPYGVIQIAECWSYFRRSLVDPTFDKVVEGAVKVSDLDRPERTEALMVRAETREGATVAWFSPIVRGTGPNLKLALGDAFQFNEPAMGAFKSFFG